jgi:hypothetical protein
MGARQRTRNPVNAGWASMSSARIDSTCARHQPSQSSMHRACRFSDHSTLAQCSPSSETRPAERQHGRRACTGRSASGRRLRSHQEACGSLGDRDRREARGIRAQRDHLVDVGVGSPVVLDVQRGEAERRRRDFARRRERARFRSIRPIRRIRLRGARSRLRHRGVSLSRPCAARRPPGRI